MQINRLFEIIYILLDKKTVTADYLAEKFEVSRRTIYRDIELLSQSGIPIYTARGKNGGISILDGFVLDKSVLSDMEQTAIVTALSAMASLPNVTDTGILERLGALFRKNASWLTVDFSEWNSEQKNIFDKLKTAVIEKRVTKIKYINSRGEVSERFIEPLHLWFKGRGWYVIAYCRKAMDNRMFRISRIRDICLGEEQFEREYEMEIDEDKYTIETTEITLKIKKQAEYRVYDEFREFKKDNNGDFIVKMNYPEDDWLYGYIMSFGEYAEIIDPKRVRDIIKKKTEKMLKKYL